MSVVPQLFRLQENHMSLIQAYQLKENELESYRRLLEMHGIWVSCKIYIHAIITIAVYITIITIYKLRNVVG